MYFLLAVFVLPAFIISILQMSFVQAYVAHRFSNKLSEDLHTEVNIGSVNINLYFNIVLKDVKINDLHHNTLIATKALVVDLKDLLFSKNLVSINNIVIDNATFNLIQYKNENNVNCKFFFDYFSSKDTTVTKGGKPWKVWAASIKVINSKFKYQDQNVEPQKEGMDYNNIEITGFNANFDNVTLFGDSIFADIRNMSMKERCGFDIKNFSAIAKVSPVGIKLKKLNIETPGTSIKMNLSLIYKKYSDFCNYNEKVKMEGLFQPSKVDFKDIIYFAPQITGMNDIVYISGEASGTVSNLKGKNFQVLYGKSTSFLGNVNITGLPNVETTYWHFSTKDFHTSQKDVQSFNLPLAAGYQHFELPNEITKFGDVKFKGAFTGFYNDFVAYGDFVTDIGKISTDITLRENRENKELEYEGKIATTNLYLGKILSMQDDLGYVSLNADISGSGFDPQNAAVSMTGTIAEIDYKKYHYKNIEIKGDLAKKKFNGYLSINDENIKLDFTGVVDYSKKLPVFDINSKVENLRLTKLHFLDLTGDSLSAISSNLKLNFEGNTIDNIQGTINASHTSYIYKGDKYLLNNFVFTNTADDNGNKTLKLKSDYIEADISGNFMFKYLYRSFQKFVEDYLPSYASWVKKKVDSIPEQNFNYLIRLKNTLPLSKLFIPELVISQNTIINGSYNTKKSILDFNLTSAVSKYKNYQFKDFFFKCKTINSKIIVNAGCDQAAISDSLNLDNLTLKCVTKNDSINYKMTWKNNNDKIKNSGDIDGFLTFFHRPKLEIKFNDVKLVINDTTWVVDKNNDIIIDSSAIAVNNLVFSTGNQQLKVFGNISENPADIMHVSFKDFNISDADALISSSGFDLNGFLNGDIDLSNIYKSLNVISDLTISDFYVNKEKLGKAVFITDWDDQKKTALVNADIIYEGNAGTNKPISVSGNYYPERKKDNFDFNIDLSNFKLKLLEKYLSSFSSSLKGYASGKLKLKGTPKEPDLTGQLFLIVKQLKIDYINEDYSFTDTVDVDKNSFKFNHLVINDDVGDSAILNGKITHKNFSDMKFDLSIRPYKMRCLNTSASQNNMFYGKAFASGLIKFTGGIDNLVMDITAKTEKNTHIFIPITSTSEISEGDFIKFVNNKNIIISKSEDYSTSLSGFQMNFNLELNPNADMQIIFDSKIGDIIKAKGNGDIKMEVNTNGDFSMYGNYVIDEGDYLFTLKNVINKKFIIQKGSTLSWNGSPYSGIADISAIYPVKAPLLDLLPTATSEDSSKYKKRVDVNCLLYMKDKIFNPTITFDIDLPNSSDDDKTLVKSNTNTDQAMNQEIFSLLIINRFTKQGNMFENASSGLSTNSTELLSDQLSNWLSQISKKVDIGVKYRPGTELTNEDLEVLVSTQLFNDKLIIDGNVQTGNNTTGTASGAGKTTNIVGDVNVEYKITNDGHFLIKGFNKSNTVDMLNNNSLYTQGVGVFYRREFDKLNDLFKKKVK